MHDNWKGGSLKKTCGHCSDDFSCTSTHLRCVIKHILGCNPIKHSHTLSFNTGYSVSVSIVETPLRVLTNSIFRNEFTIYEFESYIYKEMFNMQLLFKNDFFKHDFIFRRL